MKFSYLAPILLMLPCVCAQDMPPPMDDVTVSYSGREKSQFNREDRARPTFDRNRDTRRRNRMAGEEEKLDRLRMLNPDAVDQGLNERIMVRTLLDSLSQFSPLSEVIHSLTDEQRRDLAELMMRNLREHQRMRQKNGFRRNQQPPHPLERAKEEYRQLETEIERLAQQLSACTNPEEQLHLRQEILGRLNEGYDKRVQAEHVKLGEMEQRLNNYREQLEHRSANRERIIDEHFVHLLNRITLQPPHKSDVDAPPSPH